MHGTDVRPVGPAHFVKDDVTQDARVVHQHVDTTKGIERQFNDQLGVFRLGIESVEAIASPPAFLIASTVS